MRTIWLVRHGAVDFGGMTGRICMGQTDRRLSEEGEWQARRMAQFFKDRQLAGIFTSPLIRAVRTTELITSQMQAMKPEILRVPGLMEVNTGEWEDLPYDLIRERFPEAYAAHGDSPGHFCFPGGASLEQAGQRFAETFFRILRENPRDLLVVALAGVIRVFLCFLTGKDSDEQFDFYIPYLGLTELAQEEPDGPLQIRRYGCRPPEALAWDTAERAWEACGVTEKQRAHMIKVAETAMELAGIDPAAAREGRLPKAVKVRGGSIDPRVLWYAALMHDIKRANGKSHPGDAAEYLRREGYKELMEPVRLHHDPAVFQPDRPLSEAELLYYADKLVQEDRPVSLEERFAASRKKCAGPEAVAAHEQRYLAAKGIEVKLGRGTD